MKIKLDVAFPILVILTLLVLGITDVVHFDTSVFILAIVGAIIGWAFLIHFTIWTLPRWWHSEVGVDIFVWPAIVTATLTLLILNALFGTDWAPRDLIRFLIFAPAVLALWRREALYLRDRKARKENIRLQHAVKVYNSRKGKPDA